MYQAYNYNKMMPPLPPQPTASLPQTQAQAQAQTHRRHPLSNAVNHHVNHQAQAQHQHQQYLHPHQHQGHETHTPPKPPTKAPPSPPLPRQNSKTAPPSPPKVITDKTGRMQFNRVGFLGEGGFARVYEVKDSRGSRLACKVVTKSSLKTKKAKTKLYAEIKIHRSLQHPNIVHFQDCFEDNDNVYMTLELCTSGSLMDMLRRRRRFTEPEARFLMVQLIGACHYMHMHQVIHRDLKLGNLFLDGNMNVKVGDFGLAALIENPGERKKTICGTPNYIAPEVFLIPRMDIVLRSTRGVPRHLFRRATPHLADLTPDPSQRPTLHDIVDHGFFTQGPVPAYIPTSAHDGPPDFKHISKAQSDVNLKRLRKYSLLDVDFSAQASSGSVPAASGLGLTLLVAGAGPANTLPITSSKSVTTSIAQQEKEFQKAVQPGSPISALLSSARQPLVMGSAGGGGLQAVSKAHAKESPLGRRTVTRGLDGIVEERERDRNAREARSMRRRVAMMNVDDAITEHEEEEQRLRKKELEAQKARIVAQMAPVREEGEEEEEIMEVEDEPEVEEEEMPPPPVPIGRREKEKGREGLRARTTDRYGDLRAERENMAPSAVAHSMQRYASGSGHTTAATPLSKLTSAPALAPVPLTSAPPASRHHRQYQEQQQQPHPQHPPSSSSTTTTAAPSPQPKLNGFDAAAHTLTLAFDARAAGKLFSHPLLDEVGFGQGGLEDERVFIVSWVDYCNKYGMGYALTDGSVGVHFNDSTTVVLSPDKVHFDYITSRRQGTIFVRKSYTVSVYPDELKSKVYLLKHFERYIMDRLYGEYDYTFEDTKRERGMEWVQKYLRMKHVIVFKMSHDVLQFNFYDHSKLILSSQGLLITHIDKHYKMTRWTLRDVMAQSLLPPSSVQAGQDPEQAKFVAKLVDKLKYCKEVLISIKNAGGQAGVEGAEGMNVGMGWGWVGLGRRCNLYLGVECEWEEREKRTIGRSFPITFLL
ncbi:hypothetical protein CPB84DRAFT_1852738 [Gymnopilus junonius]|uniref:Serine/threonine-protein kinase n=1 Tax=Gymnopilus junonius TaxID=109634 RepID=A0A9P5NCE8_GYMJU|nr:hypothetical protein CPB84DRAFT_1852738 [Gymnopilus junonius]